MSMRRNYGLALVGLLSVLSSSLNAYTCYPNLPKPELIVTGTEDYTVSGLERTRYLLSVTNWHEFPNDLFEAAPDLPPCGLNTSASRTWIDIYQGNGTYLYGFCGAVTPEFISNRLWFSVAKGETPPDFVYVTLEDRRCGITYTSNLAPTSATTNIPPTADAGYDQYVSFGDEVVLDGSASSDPDAGDAITFEWTQMETGGTKVVLNSANTATASFTAPRSVQSVTFQLKVTDTQGAAATDTVIVTIFENLNNAIFVSGTLGRNPDPGAPPFVPPPNGSMERPFATLTKAVEVALSRDPNADIYVHEGDYETGTLTVRDDISLYGGFEAVRVTGYYYDPVEKKFKEYPTAEGWTRTATGDTQISSVSSGGTSVIALNVLDITNPTTIDGFVIKSHRAALGGTVASVRGRNGSYGNGFFVANYSQFDIDDVWLVYYRKIPGQEEGEKIRTLVTGNLSEAYPCDAPLPYYYNDEVLFNVAKRHDPNKEPHVGATHLFEYKQQRICAPGSVYYPYYLESRAFAPGIVYAAGHTLVRETMQIWDAGYTDHEQVTRGPDGKLYCWRMGYLTGTGFRDRNGNVIDVPRSRELDFIGPVLFDILVDEGGVLYDLITEGGAGQSSIGIYAINSSGNLHISNNTIIAEKGGSGGNGNDGLDGGLGGKGGNGGDSIGVSLSNASPTIQGNHIVTIGGGEGGFGSTDAVGGNGGNSYGVFKGFTPGLIRRSGSLPVLVSNTFEIGLGGQDGPGGVNGGRDEIYPHPIVQEYIQQVAPQTVVQKPVVVGPIMKQVSFKSHWSGSDVVMTLISPSGRVIGRDTTEPNVTHVLGPTFEIYSVLDPEAGEWTVELFGANVPEEGEETTLSVDEIAKNQPPVANAGPDQVVECAGEQGTKVTLDGTGSYDPDGDALTYTWLLNGSEIAQGAIATLKLPIGQYAIGLIVSDGKESSEPDEVVIIVAEPPPVDSLVSVSSGLVSYDRRTGQFSTNITVKNTSTTEIGEPVWLVIDGISNPAVTLAGADGTTADGKPYFDLSSLLGDGKLSPGETISKRVYFNNPSRLKFTFTPSVRGVVLTEPTPG